MSLKSAEKSGRQHSVKLRSGAIDEPNPQGCVQKEFREEAVKLVIADGLSVFESAYRLSISMKTLANWVRAAKDGKLENIRQHQRPLKEAEAKPGRVKRELAEVKMERDLLKKFATYFAKESR
ncbi:transposase [Paraburkholderia sp. BL6669N2]|nr:transposase [Paraburkholderia sp. BL6669N2]